MENLPLLREGQEEPEAKRHSSNLVDDEPACLGDELLAPQLQAMLVGWHLAHPLMEVPEESPSLLLEPSVHLLLDLPLSLELGLCPVFSRRRSLKGMVRLRSSSESERAACCLGLTCLGMERRCTDEAKHTTRLEDPSPFSSSPRPGRIPLNELSSIPPMSSLPPRLERCNQKLSL